MFGSAEGSLLLLSLLRRDKLRDKMKVRWCVFFFGDFLLCLAVFPYRPDMAGSRLTAGIKSQLSICVSLCHFFFNDRRFQGGYVICTLVWNR